MNPKFFRNGIVMLFLVVGTAALLFTWGVLGDKYGRKKILIIGLVIFAVASAACAFATSPTMLIVFRGLMGIGGAAVLPVTLAVITVVFPPHERGKAIGAWAGAVGGAVALGPVLGGLLLENPQWTSWLTNNDWGGVFLINVPIVIVGLIGIARPAMAEESRAFGQVLGFDEQLAERGVGEVVPSGESIGLDELIAILSGVEAGHVPLARVAAASAITVR